MRKIAVLTLTVLLLISIPLPAYAQQPVTNLASVIAQLLEHPAPPPPQIKELADIQAAFGGSALEYSHTNPADPGDDAPIKLLMEYWETQFRQETNRKPSEKVQHRFLQAVEEEPDFSFWVIEYLPNNAEAHTLVKRVLDQRNTPEYQYYPRDVTHRRLRDWLMTHSEFLRDELVQGAKNIKVDNADLEGGQYLEGLAKLDWQTANPLLENHAKSFSPHIAALAAGLLHKHAVESNEATQIKKFRELLKEIVANRQAPAGARQQAIKSLLDVEWDGRNDWYLSLFSDETLIQAKDGYSNLFPLAVPVKNKPDLWVPVVSKLIGNNNPIIHNAAVSCLIQFTRKNTREDVLVLLLPWLSNPGWASVGDESGIKLKRRDNNDNRTEANSLRIDIVEGLKRIKISEAVPSLLWIIQNDSERIRSQAAEVLEWYHPTEIVPVLRAALVKNEDYSTYSVMKAFIACGGLTDEEKIAALETCATKSKFEISERRGKRHLYFRGDGNSTGEEIGKIISESKYASEELAGKAILHWKKLQIEKPEVANNFWTIIQRWEFPSIDSAIAEQLSSGNANLETLLLALQRRQLLRVNASSRLQLMMDQKGYVVGIGAVVLGDGAKAEEIIKGKDSAAQIALLACARMVRERLSVDSLAEFLNSKDKQLYLAAERYLESEDSAESRNLIHARHQGEALILGANYNFDPHPKYREEWKKWESKLHEVVKKNPVTEIYAHYEVYYSDTSPFRTDSSVSVIIRGDSAEIIKSHIKGREEYRKLTSDELQQLRVLIDEVNFDTLPPWIYLVGEPVERKKNLFTSIKMVGGEFMPQIFITLRIIFLPRLKSHINSSINFLMF